MDDVIRKVTDHLLNEGYRINNNYSHYLPFSLAANESGDDGEVHVLICDKNTARYLTYSKMYNEEKDVDFVFTPEQIFSSKKSNIISRNDISKYAVIYAVEGDKIYYEVYNTALSNIPIGRFHNRKDDFLKEFEYCEYKRLAFIDKVE